jgi:GNAT superfamily N-acetyltransferase
MKQIRIASAKDKKEVTALRTREFDRSKNFKLLKPELLHWNHTDDAHTVLGIWNEHLEIIATLRLIRVANLQEAAKRLEADIPIAIHFPCLIFNSAATRQDYHRQGFNQLLRYHSIRAALAHHLQHLISPVYLNAPRLALMEKLGYTFHEPPHTWQTKLAPYSPRILAILGKNRFASARDILEKSIPHLIDTYPWIGKPISL